MAIVLVAAPLAMHVPLAVLAGVLLFVAWNMGEWREFARLKQYSNHYRLVMLGTFFLTVVMDLTVALEVGLVLACVLFVRRMGTLFEVSQQGNQAANAAVAHYTLRGVLFFGAVVKMDPVLLRVQQRACLQKVHFDCHQLLGLDTSGLEVLEQVVHTLASRPQGRVVLHGVQAQPLSLLQRSGLAKQVVLEPA
jgi:SulP family sulfate permease